MANSPLIRPAIYWGFPRGIGGKPGPLGSHDGRCMVINARAFMQNIHELIVAIPVLIRNFCVTSFLKSHDGSMGLVYFPTSTIKIN